MNRKSVSGINGLFWETHAPFYLIFYVTKVFELVFFVWDPSIEGELQLVPFMIFFVASFFGFSDGWTDARACGSDAE